MGIVTDNKEGTMLMEPLDFRPGLSSQTTFEWPPKMMAVEDKTIFGAINASNAVVIQAAPIKPTWNEVMEEVLHENEEAWRKLAER